MESNYNNSNTGFHPIEKSKTISTLTWFGYNLILLVPIVGLVFLILKAVDSSPSANKNITNWAKGKLISIVIFYVIAIVFYMVFYVSLLAIIQSINY